MITRWTANFCRLRRWFSPTEWFVHWFRLPRQDARPTERGLVLVQIDGLSHRQLNRALEAGQMPFLKSLLTKEHFQLHDFYSGLPSSTPSVQGELFYGKRCAVPAFGYRDHRTGKVVRMFARETSEAVEKRLAKHNEGVLTDGSAYCNIYSGGAREIHFCGSNLGWDDLILGHPWKLALFLSWHFWSIVRTLGLMILEFFLALTGIIRGTTSGREYCQELMMIPARVVVVILLRELATMGASMDVVRGLPVVQLNYLGYDEQAHRRGPESRFAHWTLKGIDSAIQRLWRAAHRSGRRDYDVWVYSDHGQEATTPYEYIANQRIAESVKDAVARVCGEANIPETKQASAQNRECLAQRNVEATANRARWLGTGWLVSKLFGEDSRDTSELDGIQVAALGPLGLVYTNRDISQNELLRISQQLVCEFSVPIAFYCQHDSTIAVTSEGHFDLLEHPERVFGSDHPFLMEVANDMAQLCHHPDAGDIVLGGWRADCKPVSFATQNGAHAGPGPEETHAFALLPCDITVHDRRKTYLRPDDLRQSIRRFLHPEAPVSAKLTSKSESHFVPIKVMTYNVHACIGMDGQLSPRRIARIIAQSGADIVALQELDVFRARTGRRDQAEDIAKALEMDCHFHPVWDIEEEQYGDALLSRWPMRLRRTDALPASGRHREPRGAIWVEIELSDGRRIQVLNTHLSIYPGERRLQATALAQEWVTTAMEFGPTILCGDFNARPGTPSYHRLNTLLDDVQISEGMDRPEATWFSPRPLARIDHIFVTEDFSVRSTGVISSRLARMASDHLPLVATLHSSLETNASPHANCVRGLVQGEKAWS